MKATAIAPANIAFIKYWGKADDELRLPLNSSLSMNLSDAYTTTTVELSDTYKKDSVELIDGTFSPNESDRVIRGLNRIRARCRIEQPARVVTKNTFPKGAGAAASASGFAALTVAGFAAAEMTLSEKELSIFARLGSGSACRSIPDGFVLWEKGDSSDTSYAYSLYPNFYWDLYDVLIIVDFSMKKVSTTEGHEGVKTSPLWQERIASILEKINAMKSALADKNFQMLGALIEEDCLSMHHVMQTQNPPLFYWNDTTKTIMERVVAWRNEGLGVYFTIDAGPNVHLICQKPDVLRVVEKVKTLIGIQTVIVNTNAPGAHRISQHLF